jgi:histone H2A
MSYESFNVYIKSIMRDVAQSQEQTESFQMESNACAVINDAITRLLEKLSVEMHQAMLVTGQVTLTLDTLRTVLKLHLGGNKTEMFKAVMRDVEAAVASFDKAASGSKAHPQSRAKRAGLYFNVRRVTRLLKNKYHVPRVSEQAAIGVAAVLQYLTAEIVMTSIGKTRDHGVKRITDRHIYLAIENDDELKALIDTSAIPASGAVPYVHSALVPKGKKKKCEQATA